MKDGLPTYCCSTLNDWPTAGLAEKRTSTGERATPVPCPRETFIVVLNQWLVSEGEQSHQEVAG